MSAISGFDLDSGRSRNGRPATGTATVRPYGGGGGDFVSFPLYGPWGSWYPWYSSGFGWNLGFVTYNPWGYGATSWMWGRYGMWYDPYSYYWDPGWAQPMHESSSREREPEPRRAIGSVRIKANPSDARVYIDNALVGLVGEFDGLHDHLELDGGRHVLELRAEGFRTHTQDIVVSAGKTRTVRITLKKK